MAEEPSRTGGEVASARERPDGLEAPHRSRGGEALVRFVPAAWPALWITLFAVGQWQWALFLLFMTGPVIGATLALVRGPRGSVRRQQHRDRHRAERRALYDRRVLEREQRRQGHEEVERAHGSWQGHGADWSGPASWPGHGRAGVPAPPGARGPSGPAAPPAHDPAAAERCLAGAVARARTGPGRLDPDALALVDELDAVLRPMLARARAGGVDTLVRRDLESIATEHLPGALRAYQRVPPAYAHEHRGSDGRTPAEELCSQLRLLVEGCGPLRDAVHGADVARQRELGRFLEAKFRRSDLDL